MTEVFSGIVVWVDVDEVLVSFRRMFHRHLAEKYQIKLAPDFIPNDWHYTEIFKTKEQFLKVLKDLPKDWPVNLEMYEGADGFTKTLKDLGCRVVLITHLPIEFSPERLKNLISHNIYFDEIYFTYGREKAEYSTEVVKRFVDSLGGKVVNLFIDDKALNVQEFLEKMPNMDLAVTLDLPFNKQVIEEMKPVYSQFQLDFQSKNPQEMYAKILERVHSLLKKQQKNS